MTGDFAAHPSARFETAWQRFLSSIAAADDLGILVGGDPDVCLIRAEQVDAAALRNFVFRLRIDLIGDNGSTWRSLDVRADAMLSDLHEVLQSVFTCCDDAPHHFAWFDEGGVWRCAFPPLDDIDEDAVNTAHAPLRDRLERSGDALYYRYRTEQPYELIIGLETILRTHSYAPFARCLGGQGATADDEDGTVRTWAPIDLDALNTELRAFSSLVDSGYDIDTTPEERLRYYLVWSAEEFKSLQAALPDLVEDYYDGWTHDEHVADVSYACLEEWFADCLPVVVHGTVDTYRDFCATNALDASAPLTLRAYAAHQAATWPMPIGVPPFSAGCWCGSGKTYGDCCAPGSSK